MRRYFETAEECVGKKVLLEHPDGISFTEIFVLGTFDCDAGNPKIITGPENMVLKFVHPGGSIPWMVTFNKHIFYVEIPDYIDKWSERIG